MKKLVFSLAMVVCVGGAFAAESAAEGGEKAAEEAVSVKAEPRGLSAMWPAYLAICQWPRSADVIGLRLTLPFSMSQENVTGLDVGLWGHSLYFEGLQFNVLRNDVVDAGTGIQVGLYNSFGSCDTLGLQVGLWNEANSLRGFQAGLINVVGEGQGFQVGVINRAETLYGYQVGLINIIRDAEVPFFPLLNIGF